MGLLAKVSCSNSISPEAILRGGDQANTGMRCNHQHYYPSSCDWGGGFYIKTPLPGLSFSTFFSQIRIPKARRTDRHAHTFNFHTHNHTLPHTHTHTHTLAHFTHTHTLTLTHTHPHTHTHLPLTPIHLLRTPLQLREQTKCIFQPSPRSLYSQSPQVSPPLPSPLPSPPIPTKTPPLTHLPPPKPSSQPHFTPPVPRTPPRTSSRSPRSALKSRRERQRTSTGPASGTATPEAFAPASMSKRRPS